MKYLLRPFKWIKFFFEAMGDAEMSRYTVYNCPEQWEAVVSYKKGRQYFSVRKGPTYKKGTKLILQEVKVQ